MFDIFYISNYKKKFKLFFKKYAYLLIILILIKADWEDLQYLSQIYHGL